MRRELLFLLGIIFISGLTFSGCAPEDLDEIKPEIILDDAAAFPVNCDTLYFGETFTWTATFSDNVELGAFSLEIHDNFDHHAHSTEVEACEFDPDKVAENDYYMVKEFDIPAGLTTYQVSEEIVLPESNADGMLESGDYHFFIRLTDREGWSAVKGLSVKILHREVK